MLFLEEPFKTAWENKDPFSEIQLIKGQIYRKIDTRQTLNFLFFIQWTKFLYKNS